MVLGLVLVLVLVRDELARHAWAAAGYKVEEQWRRWVKPPA